MATLTDTTSPLTDETDKVDELPRALQRSATIHDMSAGLGHRHRHSKKLSLNFPIAVQLPYDGPPTGNGSISSWTHSPTVASTFRNGTPVSAQSLPSPQVVNEESIEGPDFLTLIAGQERKVMELKEELHKAESELLSLKKQWAMFEAKKKHAERNSNLRMAPMSPKTAMAHDGEDEAERMKRREAREKIMREMAMKDGELSRSNSNSGKRNGGRVFAGRHTRTLSLLQTNAVMTEIQQNAAKAKSRTDRSPSIMQPLASDEPVPSTLSKRIDEDARKMSRQSMSRQPTLQGLIASSATGAAQLNFGKTYKDLANAGRRSLPPGADVFVKQGRQVYDGVSQGFWNFVEDIRQATVGDEPVNGTAPEQPRREVKKTRSKKKLAEHECERHGRAGHKTHLANGKIADEHKSEKDDFWKEFGLETPQGKERAKDTKRPGAKRANHSSAPVKDHESKSSTDSSNRPPSLLADLMDVNEDDEAWDSWLAESPVAQRHTDRQVNIRRSSDDGDNDSDGRSEQHESRREFAVKKAHLPAETSWAELTT